MAQTISFWHRLIQLIAPRACPVCGQRLTIGEEVVCARCNLHLPRTGFAADAYENVMAKRFWGRIPVERAAALFYYEAGSEVSRIIYDLKYHHHPEIGWEMGRLTAQEFAREGFFEGVDLIVPIPLAKRRERQRGYNQSLEIARGVAEWTHLPICRKVVKRTRFEGSQTHQSIQGRMENVEGVFQCYPKAEIKDKHILLVDDIVTTGATIVSCANELRKGGAAHFSVLSLGFAKS